jgi:hypothetical protein
MAEDKKGIVTRVTEYLAGDREPGETAPPDDSHVKGSHGNLPIENPEPELNLDDGSNPEPMYRVEIAGIEREVNQATYDAVMAERASQAAAAPALEPEPESEQDISEFYEDPEGALRKMKAEAVQEATTQIRRNYAADQAQQEFWAAFYKENPLLEDEPMLVKMTLAQNMKNLRNLDGKTGRDKLAGLVEEQILRISNKQRGRNKQPDATTNLEGGTVTVPITAEESDALAANAPAHRPPSIGDALKGRKLNRDRARRGETQLS